MKRHDTPPDVASALLRHAPRNIRALLDPSVGAGNLITPIMHRLKKSQSIVYCVDSDIGAISSISMSFRHSFPSAARFIHADFISWSMQFKHPRFDCVVMNPPFAAKKNNMCQLARPATSNGTSLAMRCMPIEAAFICRAIDLLESGGRLLAIAPCSIVMSETMQWLRNEMLANGSIRYVHELPPRCFPRVDSRMYLMVFDKGSRRKQIEFLNHDLHKPDRLEISLTKYTVTRLDYGYVNAIIKMGLLRKLKLQWTRVGDVAEVLRGDIKSPAGPRCVVHSTDYYDGYWHSAKRHDRSVFERRNRRVRRGDILISRVGRNASRTAGYGIMINGMACSDCVIIVRPKEFKMGLNILFALRVMLSIRWITPLVEKGTGASYIAQSSLRDFVIPMGIGKRYLKEYREFEKGEGIYSCRHSSRAVEAVARMLNIS